MEIHQPQVCERLLHVHGCQAFHRLQLYHDAAAHKKVHSKSILDADAIELERHDFLTFHLQPAPLELPGQ